MINPEIGRCLSFYPRAWILRWAMKYYDIDKAGQPCELCWHKIAASTILLTSYSLIDDAYNTCSVSIEPIFDYDSFLSVSNVDVKPIVWAYRDYSHVTLTPINFPGRPNHTRHKRHQTTKRWSLLHMRKHITTTGTRMRKNLGKYMIHAHTNIAIHDTCTHEHSNTWYLHKRT